MVMSAVAFEVAEEVDGAEAAEADGADEERLRRPRGVRVQRGADSGSDCDDDDAKNAEARRDKEPCGIPAHDSRAAARAQSAAEAAPRIAATDMAGFERSRRCVGITNCLS